MVHHSSDSVGAGETADSEVDSALVFSSTTEFLKQLGSRTMTMLRGGAEAQESAVPRQFRNPRASADDMEVDEEAVAPPQPPPQASGQASDSEAEQSAEEESKSKVCFPILRVMVQAEDT